MSGEVTPRFGAGMSAHADAKIAAEQAVDACVAALAGRRPDLCFLFVSTHHADHAGLIAEIVRRTLDVKHIVGSSAEGVIGGASELERTPAVSLLALKLPGSTIKMFGDTDLPPMADEEHPEIDRAVADAIGAGPELRAAFLFADPFSTPTVRLIPALNAARHRDEFGNPTGLIFGGIASGASRPGLTRLVQDVQVHRRGLVGVSISGGATGVESVVSQGCRPVGQPLVITKAKGNVILQLAGRRATDVVQEVVSGITEADRERLKASGGLLLGRVINEYKERFGRADFLIRALLGAEPEHGAIAVADLVRTGQTVQFFMRDAQTASQDLAMLLDAQRMHEAPGAALLISCTGRGSRLFGTPSHDAGSLARAFGHEPSAERKAKGGFEILAESSPVPTAGFFASGEIGPVGRDSYLHGHSACVALFRAKA